MDSSDRIPPVLRWGAALWLIVWVPAYWRTWGAVNFLHFCDIGVILTCAAAGSATRAACKRRQTGFIATHSTANAGWPGALETPVTPRRLAVGRRSERPTTRLKGSAKLARKRRLCSGIFPRTGPLLRRMRPGDQDFGKTSAGYRKNSSKSYGMGLFTYSEIGPY